MAGIAGALDPTSTHRTPVINRTFVGSMGQHTAWQPQHQVASSRHQTQRQPFAPMDRSFGATSLSDRSDSVHEVENLVLGNSNRPQFRDNTQGGWSGAPQGRPMQRVTMATPSVKKTSGGFRPAGVPR
ncbi:hypothetical protein JAAARDRAFT_234787 [Jaapia argillacea MUCL 33604]|uniref:Uncharacterized protein n=1 Tax=Jaapia argillacea MUCL 33604 TaxID=933084 RepID=A0A067QMC4_9AGAM|nr:hypothetical protein JAAARDRAFT_234787 [Jaapia argillacea MUCL 33604]